MSDPPAVTDLDEHCLWLFNRPAHPEANRALPDSKFFWRLIDDDRLHNAAVEFGEWRRANPDAPVAGWLKAIAAEWDLPTTYDERILSDEAIQAQLDADPHFDVDFFQAVCVLDVTIIATAFCDFFLTGEMDAETRRIASLAIRREMLPAVLAAQDAGPETPGLSKLLKIAS